MSLNTNIYLELLDIIDDKEMVIQKQDKIIRRLLEENLEKENLISELSGRSDENECVACSHTREGQDE
ncbi:hypothetical protein [Andreesenia angusta]|nr:hypothetical protein [Andreesenia angusta]